MAVAVGEQRRKREAMDHLVIDISKGDEEHISASIRVAIERGWLHSFMDSLTDAKRKKEAEIDRICSRHYGDFLLSVNEMLKLRNNAGNLGRLVLDVHKKFNSNSQDLTMVLNELHQIQTERQNALKLSETTKHCKKITQLMVKTGEQIEADDYYNAMRSIETIQHDFKLINLKSLSTCLDRWLPIAINKLLYGVRTEADTYLVNSRKKIQLIGSTILGRQAMINIGITLLMLNTTTTTSDNDPKKETSSNNDKKNSPNSNTTSNNDPKKETSSSNENDKKSSCNNNTTITTSNNSICTNSKRTCISLQHVMHHKSVFNFSNWATSEEFEAVIPQHFYDPILNEGIELIDNKLYEIAPLHKVLHLYAVLGNLESYHDHYRRLRSNYLKELLTNADRNANDDRSEVQGLANILPGLFDQLIGFFTIECTHRRCVEVAEGVFSHIEIITLWEEASRIISKLCKDLSVTVTSPEVLIRIKDDIILLINVVTDEAYGFNCDILHEVLRYLWEIFRGLQITAAIKCCMDALNTCAYQPYTSSTEEEYNTHVKAFQLDLIEPEDEDILTSRNTSKRASVTTKLKERENKREKSMLTEKAAANLDALEDELMSKVTTLHSPTSSSSSSLYTSPGDITGTTVGGRERSSSSAIRNRNRSHSNAPILSNAQTRLRRLSFVTNPNNMYDPLNNDNKDGQLLNNTYKNINKKKIIRSFAFSSAVPMVLRELHVLLIRFFLFAVKNDELGARSEDICLAIVNVLQVISKSLKSELNKDGSETPLSKACQIAIDAATLSLACDSLWLMVESGLKHFHWTENLENYITKAIDIGTGSIKQVVIDAQALIFELLINKIDGLLESLAFINYIPSVIPDGPHESVSAIVDFLQITFVWLAHLPITVKEAVHFSCCSKLAQGILSYILSPAVPHINILCILAFDFDLKILLHFADSCGIKHLKQSFTELQEVIKCILHPALLHYGENKSVRMDHFPSIQTSKLTTIIEKMTPIAVMTTSVTSKLPLLDKNTIRNLAKKLKTQI